MFGYDSGELVGQGVAVVNAADETSPQETADTIIHSLNETGTWSGEVHNVKKDGDRFWCHAVVSTLDHPEFGRVWVALHEDVTEHKQAEEALRAESERNQRILAGAMDGFVTLDLNGRFCDVNAAYCAIVGYSRDELLGMSIQDVEAQETAEETAQHIEMVLKTGHDRFESKMRRNDGRLIDVEVSANLIDIGGNAQICSFIRDVTERKCAEQTLQESEKRYRNLFHQAPISLWEEDFSALATWFDELRETGVGDLREYLQDHPAAVQKAARLIRVVDVNEGTLRLFGVESMAELLSTSLKAVEEQRGSAFSNQAFAEQLIAIWEGQRRFETEFAASTPEGAHIDCLLQWVAPPQAPGKLDLSYVIIAISDITERKRAEEKLRESDARFRAIFEGAGIGMALADMDGRLVESNATFQQMLGYDAQELRGMVFTDFTHPEDAAVDMALYKELEARKRHHYQIEKRYIRKDGQLVYGQLTVSLVHGNGAKPQFAIGMVEDITAHKKAEEALRDSEIRFRTTFESAAIPMVLGDVHGGFIETNPAFRKLFGYSAEELAELKFNDITHPKDIERGWDLFKQLVAGTISTLQIEKRYIRKDGSVILANTSASAIHDSRGRLLHTVAMVQDIPASRQAQAKV
ncbi:MAG: PAS domain S-box protein, partial [Planctomycetes bacterium]|nr:PAS domain S-box protein [Planctomycetota bacterium]